MTQMGLAPLLEKLGGTFSWGGALGSGGAGGGGESGFHAGHQLSLGVWGLMVCELHWANLSQGEGGTGSTGLALWASEGCCKHLSQVGYVQGS